MKKMIIFLVATTFCGCKVEQVRYRAGDRVINFHTGIAYTIDSVRFRNGKQVFYSAHNEQVRVNWLPQNSIR